MDKNAIKKFAVWARRELIARVSQRAALYEITEQGFGDPYAESVHGQILTSAEKKERKALIEQIKAKGYQEVMEEVAYTWFNRFCALRFMEVNGYLPSHVRVFTDDDNAFKPQILAEAINLELDGLDMEKVYALKNDNETEELFKYLLIVQCNALNPVLPGMFQKIEDYTELLFPDHLLRAGSVIEQMVAMIPEDDWQDQVQIIGWLYQYYNSEKKDEVFAALKKNVKITKENIPAATQLFTPDWIVRYMVENSLGRLWVEGHPNDALKSQWKYYLEEAEQEPAVQIQLDEIRKEYAALNPEEIKCIDPCCGSGHILAYMFDVLVQIYEAQGYSTRDAVKSIVENNLYGLDIDDRAAQLAYFSVMMKGRQYDSRFFKRGVQPHVFAIEESNNVDKYALEYFCNGDVKLTKAMNTIIKELHDAKEYGSILTVTPQDWAYLYDRFGAIIDDISMYRETALAMNQKVQVAEILSKKYDVVVTNPPYMGGNGMSVKLIEYLKLHFPESKTDLYSVFIEHCGTMTKKNGYRSMITQHGWMFLSSFEKLRSIIAQTDIVNMAHLGARAFDEISGEIVQTTTFVTRNRSIPSYYGIYVRLLNGNSEATKEKLFLSGKNKYKSGSIYYRKIPGKPIAYWFSPRVIDVFGKDTLANVAKPRQGLATGDNDKFLRLWPEVNYTHIGFGFPNRQAAKESKKKWYPCNKGGGFRKWYGNNDYIVNWENDGFEIKNNYDEKGRLKSRPQNIDFYFKEGMTWSTIASGNLGMRYSPLGFMFETKGSVCFPNDISNLNYLLGLMNTPIVSTILSVLSPTLDFHEGPIGRVPTIIDKNRIPNVNALVEECKKISKTDWDSFETSWDFKRHPLVPKLDENCNEEN